MSSWRMSKTIGKKDIFCFVGLYLKINISEFWLILLDHITYGLDSARKIYLTNNVSQWHPLYPYGRCAILDFYMYDQI